MIEQWTAAWGERHAARIAAWRAGRGGDDGVDRGADGSGYVGRFAPSPTGPLHAGSLVAALATYLDARAHGGRWLVRMEDLDPPRTVPGAAAEILATLAACGLTWDGEVMVQSTRGAAYQAAFDRLCAQGHVYACACTRKEIADSVTNLRQHRYGRELVYPGTCRAGIAPGRAPRAWRLRVDNAATAFVDALQGGDLISFADVFQGARHQNLAAEVGDFVLKRADGLWAYQLAVVVDDAEQGVTHVVRGADLLDSTPRQILLQRLLGVRTPEYAHIGVLTDDTGEKLSKQTGAPAVTPENAAAALAEAARFLFAQHG